MPTTSERPLAGDTLERLCAVSVAHGHHAAAQARPAPTFHPGRPPAECRARAVCSRGLHAAHHSNAREPLHARGSGRSGLPPAQGHRSLPARPRAGLRTAGESRGAGALGDIPDHPAQGARRCSVRRRRPDARRGGSRRHRVPDLLHRQRRTRQPGRALRRRSAGPHRLRRRRGVPRRRAGGRSRTVCA